MKTRFNVGDFVTLNSELSWADGTVYKISMIASGGRDKNPPRYRLLPVFLAFAGRFQHQSKVYIIEDEENMVIVDVVRAGVELMKMQQLMRDLVSHCKGEEVSHADPR